MMPIAGEQAKRLWRKSIAVGLILFGLVLGSIVERPLVDENMWALAYVLIGYLILWPYQLYLTAKLWSHDGGIIKYLGLVLSIASIGVVLVPKI